MDSITPATGIYKNTNKLSALLKLMGGEEGGPDIISLQETKRNASEGMPPLSGYVVAATALQLTRANGCAIYVKKSLRGCEAIDDFDTVIGGKKQGRLVGVRITGEDISENGPVAIFGVYAVNTLGKSVTREKEQARADMDAALHAAISKEVTREPKTRIIVAGDLNVTMSLLDKGKSKDTNRWGESHYDDIPSPIARVEGLMEDFDLEDSWRVTHPNQKVNRHTRTTTWAANSAFGRDGCRLDYILVSRKKGEEEAIGKEKHADDSGSGDAAAGESPRPSAKRRKVDGPRWFSKSEVYYGKGWRLSNDNPGSGSDHLPCVLELDK